MDKRHFFGPQDRGGDVGYKLRIVRLSDSERRIWSRKKQSLHVPTAGFETPSVISVFHRLLERSIQCNTILTMQYIDNATLVPAELKEERKHCYT
jgi:hypothetical protein